MKNVAQPATLARRGARRSGVARALAVLALAVSGTTPAACGGAADPTVVETRSVVDTSTLAGTWTGTLDGGSAANSYGPSTLTLTLRADSTFTSKASNPLYCDLNNAVWRVSGTQFTATGRDCGGTIVTFAAPVLALRLTGAWSASSGRSGTFTVGKQ